MLKILIGFLPWILYFVFIGTRPEQQELAVLAALVTTFIFNFNELKKGFILTWGTLIFFLFLTFAVFYIHSDWMEHHANLIANSGLALIAWFSLIIGKPFTIQYAREQVAKEFWQTPTFIRINQIITLVWATSFLIAVGLSILHHYFFHLDSVIYQIFSYTPTVAAIWFTKKFPDWYKQHSANRFIRHSEQLQKSNFFLTGNFAPILDELDSDNLMIEGELPQDLTGVYMRNGPNPAFPPFSYSYPFDGDGMIHAIYLESGKARYKNRFVLTLQLKAEQRIGKAMYGGVNCPLIRDSNLLLPDEPHIPVKLGRFIHVIRHANQYIALHEAESAYQIDRELKTLGEWNPTNAKEAISVNAHTRLDSATGELFFIAYHLDKPVIDYHVMDKNGVINQSGFIDVPYSCMIHDFVLTKNYMVIFLCPVVVSLQALVAGHGLGQWKPQLNTRVAVLSRQQLSQNVIWLETEAFFTYHYANGYEFQNEIIIDHVRYPEFTAVTENSRPAHLYQTIIDIKQKKCRHIQKDDRSIEFPRINDGVNSREYRYIYSAANLHNQKVSNDIFNALIKYDIKTGTSIVHDFGSHYEIGEAVFAPKINATEEDDGYLLFFIYNRIENKSDFVILDARRINEKPLAIIKLPCRVPNGLHGSWMPHN